MRRYSVPDSSGGREVTADHSSGVLNHDFPECCLVYVKSGGKYGNVPQGSGVVIGTNRVLTAAHVVFDKKDIAITFNSSRNGKNLIRAEKVWIHKKYISRTRHYDLAILDFAQSLKKPTISPGSFTGLSVGSKLTIVGYGDTNPEGYKVGDYKNYLPNVELISNRELHGDTLQNRYGYWSSIEFIIGPRPCEFDSGAPILSSSGTQRKLLGIMSRKVKSSFYPGTNVPNCLRDTICTRIDNLNINNYVRQ